MSHVLFACAVSYRINSKSAPGEAKVRKQASIKPDVARPLALDQAL